MQNENSLDLILGDLIADAGSGDEATIDSLPMTLWIPHAYKARFDALQARTKKKFGKKLKEVVMAAIDRVDSSAGKATLMTPEQMAKMLIEDLKKAG